MDRCAFSEQANFEKISFTVCIVYRLLSQQYVNVDVIYPNMDKRM